LAFDLLFASILHWRVLSLRSPIFRSGRGGPPLQFLQDSGHPRKPTARLRTSIAGSCQLTSPASRGDLGWRSQRHPESWHPPQLPPQLPRRCPRNCPGAAPATPSALAPEVSLHRPSSGLERGAHPLRHMGIRLSPSTRPTSRKGSPNDREADSGPVRESDSDLPEIRLGSTGREGSRTPSTSAPSPTLRGIRPPNDRAAPRRSAGRALRRRARARRGRNAPPP
jgi:hypothetical protein